ncbi:hypothetical protein A33Q_1448 [Indibacter alkaliphilus LW1]|uniref:Uncharacterized protein n=1 Tax=Indibacter alkaliphilus (strain CCUG 57479 / KCTC 22604 / LW1) TaxID=1189612 RepID=S2DID5_INDAL|nr:hypothetical protein A33Q_1448 [Indibacter alkaliphilus LW1]
MKDELGGSGWYEYTQKSSYFLSFKSAPLFIQIKGIERITNQVYQASKLQIPKSRDLGS